MLRSTAVPNESILQLEAEALSLPCRSSLKDYLTSEIEPGLIEVHLKKATPLPGKISWYID